MDMRGEGMSEERSGSHRDPIEFTMAALGKAKTAAEIAGRKLVTEFEHVERISGDLRENHGMKITPNQVTFDHPVTQAAWLAKQGHDLGPPMMQLEDELAERVSTQFDK
jgi:hypothetical protein